MAIDPRDFALVQKLCANIESVIFGKPAPIKLLVTALLARGHVLIEDIPGIGKTALARALARSLSCTFRRIQFTPDLLPSDVTGISIFDQDQKEFRFRPGPIFAHIVLADEINRATPRTQSALLEAMNENRVSVDGTTHPIPMPFMVVATQNPIEFTGTYPLPESQLDRFLLMLRIGYPSLDEERRILETHSNSDPIDRLQPALTEDDVNRLADKVHAVRLDDAITSYVLEIVNRTRQDKSLVAGVSPRGAIHLARGARAHALVEGRDYATPDDVKAVAVGILAHRVIEKRLRASQDGRTGGAQIIRRILQEVPVPQ